MIGRKMRGKQNKSEQREKHGSGGAHHARQVKQMWRNNKEKVRGSTLQISVENGKRYPSKIQEKLELRVFAAKKGINTPD